MDAVQDAVSTLLAEDVEEEVKDHEVVPALRVFELEDGTLHLWWW